ncbi:MAG TPA: type II toxin-antitoxin system VapC family toxin [Terracidiphilus sp.]
MIVLDVNLLIYAYDSTTPEHAIARAWLEGVLSGQETVALPWPTIYAFLRVLTHPGTSGAKLTLQAAVSIVDQWMDLPNVRTLASSNQHWLLLREMLIKGDARGRLTTDAALAALTIEHAGILYTNDRDFARFPGLRWVNPLQKS